VTVIVKLLVAATVGVPVMVPDTLSSVSPAGRPGDVQRYDPVPPVAVMGAVYGILITAFGKGDVVAITNGCGEIVRDRSLLAVWGELLASETLTEIVNEPAKFGEPESKPVEESDKPRGTAGEDQFNGLTPPVAVNWIE
jgi:hypothetical protein